MSHPVKISVVMPVYNKDMYLQDSIESILNQTYDDFEFIIVDDGSSQPTREILSRSADKDKRIKILSNHSNKGISYSRNLGNRVASGKYIAIMDSDDISLPDRFEKQLQYLENHPEIAVLGAQILATDSKGNQLWRSSYPVSPGLVRWGMIFGCVLAHPVVMMRREIFSNSDFQYGDEIVAQDFALWTMISARFKMANLPDYLLLYRLHDNNASTMNKNDMQDETFNIIRDQISKLTGEHLTDNLINGIISSNRILNYQDAASLSNVIIKLEKAASSWDIKPSEKKEIQKLASYKLRTIWNSQNMVPDSIRLLPYLLYSFFLYLGLKA